MTKYVEVSWVFSDTGERYHAAIAKPEQILSLIAHTRKRHNAGASVTIGPDVLMSLSDMGI